MTYIPPNANGAATSANSAPVVIASDQSAVPVSATNLDIRNLTNTDVVTAELSATDNAVLDAIEVDTSATATSVASIDTKATATNTKLDTLITQTDAVESTLTTIDGRVDGLETSNTAIQTAVELIDDTVATLGTTTYTEAVNKGLVVGAVRRDANTTLVGTTNEVAPLQVNATGELKVAQIAALPAGTNNIGDVDVLTVITGTGATNLGKARDSAIGATDTGVANLMVRRDTPTAETPAAGDYVVPQTTSNGAQYVANIAYTAGGATPYKLVSAATTNATSVKASAGQVYMITASNVNAAARYLKLYNKASAPTVGTDVPVHTFIIPGNTAGAGTNIPVPTVGIAFSTGIAFALTTEATDAGTTAVAASEIVVNLAYL